MRKLRVLPVPVEAVARMSEPSSAGGMALAWTGVGRVKPALVRRFFRESEMLKLVKRTSLTRERPECFAASCAGWEGLEGRVWSIVVFQGCRVQNYSCLSALFLGRLSSGIRMQRAQCRRHGFQLVSIACRFRSAAAARRDSSDDEPPARATSAASKVWGRDAVGRGESQSLARLRIPWRVFACGACTRIDQSTK